VSTERGGGDDFICEPTIGPTRERMFDEMALGITERHGPIAPWLGGWGQNPFDPDSVDAGIRLVDVLGSKIED